MFKIDAVESWARVLGKRRNSWRAAAVAASALTLGAAAPGPAPDTNVHKYGAPFCGSNKWDWIETKPRFIAHDSAGSCIEVPTPRRAAMKVSTAPDNGSFPNISSGWELGANSCPSAADLKHGLCFRYPVKVADEGNPVASVKGHTSPGYVGNFAFDTWFSTSDSRTSFQDRCSPSLSKGDTELMVWLSHPGDLQPYSPDGYYTTRIDGRWWHVLMWETFNHCPAGQGWRLVIFTSPRVTNGEVTVHNLKLNSFFSYAIRQGWLKKADYLQAIDLGWEMDYGGAGNAIDHYDLTGVK